MKTWIAMPMMLLTSVVSYGQAVPTAEASIGSGPNVSWVDGTIHYSLTGSQLIQDGLYGGSGNITTATNLSGNVGFASTSKNHPFSLIYAGGILIGTAEEQGTTTFQNIAVSQELVTGKWIFGIANAFSYLPQSPTTGYSGISGVGDQGSTPIVGPSGGPAGGVLTFAANRISNQLTGNVERRLTGATSLSGSANWSVLHFLEEQAGLNTTQISGQVGVNHRIDARNSVGANVDYSTYHTNANSSFGQPESPSFQTRGINFTYMRLWTRALSMDASAGPQWISSSSGAVIPPSVNVAATVGLNYTRQKTNMGLHYSRGVNGGSGVQTGALSDSIMGSVGRPLSRNWMGSVNGNFTRTSGLVYLAPLPGGTIPAGANETTKSFYGGVQVTRALGRFWSCFFNYTAQDQSINSAFIGQNAFSGFSQTFGIGITYAPRSTRLGEFKESTMLGHRVLTMEDYGAILKRRWWIIVIPTVVLPIVAVAIAFVIPPQYVSQTLVLVEQQKVPDEYVKPVVSEDLTARLASMKEQILSRARLTPIIERFNLFGTAKTSMDERLDLMRKNIDIKPIHSEMARTGGLPGFFISFRGSDARTAQLVTGEITSLFVNENLKSRATSVEGTQDFLRGQLADAKEKLDDQDAKLAAFQQKYIGKLPGEETPNMNMLTSLNTQLDATTQAIARMEQDKSYEEAMLAQQQSMSAQVSEHGGVAPQAQQADLQALLSEEADLTKRYTDDYPDVVAVRRKIKDLRKEMAAAPVAAAPTPVSAPNRSDSIAVQQLRAQLRALEQGLTQKKHDQGVIQGQVRIYQDRISSSPLVQEEYKGLTRDYTTAQAFYDDLLKKMNDSKMATDLEKRQQGEQFRVMDEPNLPDSPSFPKRGIFAGAGLAAGLCLGLMIVALMEYKDTALRSERDIWAFTKLPTLSVIAFTGESEPVEVKRQWKFWRRKPNMAAAGKPLANAGG